MVQIARDMRALPEETRKAVRPALREAGAIVQKDAQARASWSGRIPASIKVVTSFRQNREGVTVRAGGTGAPHARPYEGLSSRGGTFRHPVHGNDWWVAQASRPFLFPAAEANVAAVTAAMRGTLDEAARSLGFEG
jgi:hypothetical protein